jgi:hypothetical protein
MIPVIRKIMAGDELDSGRRYISHIIWLAQEARQ